MTYPAIWCLRMSLAAAAFMAAFASQVSEAAAARPSGTQLFVSEAYDVSGGFNRAVSFPIANGLVQPGPDEVYDAEPAEHAIRPSGSLIVCRCFYNPVKLDTLSPLNGDVLSSTGC